MIFLVSFLADTVSVEEVIWENEDEECRHSAMVRNDRKPPLKEQQIVLMMLDMFQQYRIIL